MDIFTRTIHGIRLKYAAVSVVFLAVALTLFYLGGPRSFGWLDFIVIFVLLIMGLVLFMLQCHCVIAPIERMTDIVNRLMGEMGENESPLMIKWSGKDEFACLAASLNGLLEAVQRRNLGLSEENHRLKTIIASAEVELVVMNTSGIVLDIVHCPSDMEPVPGLVCGAPPDPSVWSEVNRRALMTALAAVRNGDDAQAVELPFRSSRTNITRRIRTIVRRTEAVGFPIVIFRDECKSQPVAKTTDGKVPLSRIAAGVSRDLKGVFTVIATLADRYANSEKPEVRETISKIREAIRSGDAMMEQLLTLGGESRMNLKSVGVQSLIDIAKPIIAELTEPERIGVDYDITCGQDRLMVDVRQFGRVVEIIVRNSVDAFGNVPGRIRISSRTVELSEAEGAEFNPPQTAGCGVIISFEDDGPGISEEVLAHVFEPYCSTKSGRRGLGLAVANSIIAAHGGGMRINSEKGIRTTVDVFLRISERSREDVEQIHKEFPGGEVLVVDDNRSVLRITAALLRTQKISAHIADCRPDAIRKFGELSTRLRAVFLDAQLGDSNSIGVLQNMRDIDAKVPIIVVSGYTKREIDAMFSKYPPDGFLMKPYTVSELSNLLSSLTPRSCDCTK